MVITVNTETLDRISALSKECESKLEEASAVSKKVVEHNDWNCYERDAINESILTTKKEMDKLMTAFYDFAAAVGRSSSGFRDALNSIPGLFQNLEVMIGSDLSVVNSSVTGAGAGSVLKQQSENVSFDNMLESYEFSSLDSGINICDYSSFV